MVLISMENMITDAVRSDLKLWGKTYSGLELKEIRVAKNKQAIDRASDGRYVMLLDAVYHYEDDTYGNNTLIYRVYIFSDGTMSVFWEKEEYHSYDGV